MKCRTTHLVYVALLFFSGMPAANSAVTPDAACAAQVPNANVFIVQKFADGEMTLIQGSRLYDQINPSDLSTASLLYMNSDNDSAHTASNSVLDGLAQCIYRSRNRVSYSDLTNLITTQFGTIRPRYIALVIRSHSPCHFTPVKWTICVVGKSIGFVVNAPFAVGDWIDYKLSSPSSPRHVAIRSEPPDAEVEVYDPSSGNWSHHDRVWYVNSFTLEEFPETVKVTKNGFVGCLHRGDSQAPISDASDDLNFETVPDPNDPLGNYVCRLVPAAIRSALR
jgi:hypothetical protein